MKPLTVGELFAGICGIGLGLERTGGFETVFQVESDPYATRVLEKHWPGVRRWGDVRTFIADAQRLWKLQPQGCQQKQWRRFSDCREAWRRANYVDLICGGFPCPPVSLAGKRRGAADARWLWGEIAVAYYIGQRILEAEKTPARTEPCPSPPESLPTK